MSWTDYKRLLADRNTDPEAWAAAAKANPNDPHTACKIAVEADPWAAADLLLRLTRRDPGLLTTQEVAERLGAGHSTVTLWCRRGLFPNAIQGPETGGGAVWLIPESDLDGFERPRRGYPKGRPRSTDAGGDAQETD